MYGLTLIVCACDCQVISLCKERRENDLVDLSMLCTQTHSHTDSIHTYIHTVILASLVS